MSLAALPVGAPSMVGLQTRQGVLAVPAVGVGCWSWGDDKGVWGWQAYDRSLTKGSIAGAFNASVQANLRLFDTAETYGSGLSEKIVGELVHDCPLKNDLFICTKWQPGKWARNPARAAILQAARESCARLKVRQIDLYQIHAPLHRDSLTEQGLGLADVVDAGLAKAVGVSNFSLEQVRQVHAALASRGIPLSTNQIEYSILRQLPDMNGLKAGCEALGVRILAYSPLAMGRLTGKYSAKNEPKGNRGFGAVPMRELEPLLARMREIGARYGASPAQVAIAWVIAKGERFGLPGVCKGRTMDVNVHLGSDYVHLAGAIPIPGAKNIDQAAMNAGALTLRLTPQEVQVWSLKMECVRIQCSCSEVPGQAKERPEKKREKVRARESAARERDRACKVLRTTREFSSSLPRDSCNESLPTPVT